MEFCKEEVVNYLKSKALYGFKYKKGNTKSDTTNTVNKLREKNITNYYEFMSNLNEIYENKDNIRWNMLRLIEEKFKEDIYKDGYDKYYLVYSDSDIELYLKPFREKMTAHLRAVKLRPTYTIYIKNVSGISNKIGVSLKYEKDIKIGRENCSLIDDEEVFNIQSKQYIAIYTGRNHLKEFIIELNTEEISAGFEYVYLKSFNRTNDTVGLENTDKKTLAIRSLYELGILSLNECDDICKYLLKGNNNSYDSEYEELDDIEEDFELDMSEIEEV